MARGAVKQTTGNVLGSVQLLHKIEEMLLRWYHNVILAGLGVRYGMTNPSVFRTIMTQFRVHEAEYIRLHKKNEKLVKRFTRHNSERSKMRVDNFPPPY